MTIARGAALAALVLAIALVAVLLLRGGRTHEYDLLFQNAGQLVKGDDVQVGGRRVGSIRSIELADDNRARVRIQVQEPVAPLREGTQAVIRLTSLSGIANRYVALTPAPSDHKALPDGGRLEFDSTTGVVDLDQVFNTLDPKARKDLQGVVDGFAAQYQGKGREAGESAEYFNPFLSTSRRLVSELTRDEGALTDFIVNTSRAVTAIAERRDDLSSLVDNANATSRAIGGENVALARALGLLPTTLRRANTTFVNLRATLDDLDVLVAESKPATRRLAPFLRELRPLVADARPTIRDLRRLVTRSGTDNDLIDATHKLPSLQRVASPTFAHSQQSLQKAQPVLEFIRPYIPEFEGWLRDFGAGAANYDANGHFARIQPIFNAFSFTDNAAGGVLTPQGLDKKFDGLQTNVVKRCPGTASQRAQDNSAPYTDNGNLGPEDCDPSLVLPGP
ncbi:MAG TPA: MlaD family protein [Solirubrobacteraceae bacterium]|nr:MlaD family protein [Solirubrobacteraceae bacterium]